MLRDDLVDLLDRMSIDEPLCDSDDSISWHAHREAEELKDLSMIDELATYARQERNKDRRNNAYFVIAKIGLNTDSTYSAKVLVEFLDKETHKYVLDNLLTRISEFNQPLDVNWESVFPHLRDPRWTVRHSAIWALRCCDTTRGEQEVLEILNSSINRYDLEYCCSTLSFIGSTTAIPSLERALTSRSRYVKFAAKCALESIKQRNAV